MIHCISKIKNLFQKKHELQSLGWKNTNIFQSVGECFQTPLYYNTYDTTPNFLSPTTICHLSTLAKKTLLWGKTGRYQNWVMQFKTKVHKIILKGPVKVCMSLLLVTNHQMILYYTILLPQSCIALT
jgi:hypothetical protein